MNKNYKFGLSSTFADIGKRTKSWVLNWVCALVMFGLLATSQLQAQIAVTVTGSANTSPALAATYTSLANALTALNAVTAMTGPVTLTLAAGGSETAPATGLFLGSATLNPVLSATNTITIVKATGASTVLNAGLGGIATPASAAPDGIFSLRGADFVTIDGLTFTDGNTTNPATMEYGLGLFKLSAGDGANNNTIQNCIFNMQRINNVTGGTPMVEGSVSILVINSVANNILSLTPTNGGTSATNGTNSNNKFYTNTINGGNYGIVLSGFAATVGVGPAPVATTFLGDLGNDIGGTIAGTGNTILNFGGVVGAATASAGIRANHQWGINISYNSVDNNNGSGVNHVNTLRGIFAQAGTSANATITNNTVSVKSAATGSAATAIENGIGATTALNTVNINNNTILNSAITATPTSGTAFTGILNTASAANLNMNNNIVRGTTSTATTGGFIGISNIGAVTTTLNMNANQIGNSTSGAVTFSAATSGAVFGITSTGTLGACTTSMAGNNLQGFVHSINGSSTHTYLRVNNADLSPSVTIQNNTFTNISVASSGTVIFIDHNYSISAAGQSIISNNSIVTAFARTVAGALTLTTTAGSSPNSATTNYINNNFSNITVTGASTILGFNNTDGSGSSPTKAITGNIFNNWIGGINAITCMNFGYWGGVSSLSNNTITNITGANAITAIILGSTANLATSILVSGNIINNITSTNTGVVGTVIGISCSNTSAGIVITNNTINTLSSTSTSITISGISMGNAPATGTVISRNKIYDISGNQGGTTVNGINFTAGTRFDISNNIIGDLRATASVGTNAVQGLNLSATSTYNVFHNTIRLNAVSSSATTFGTTCITYSSTVTTLNLRNNILVNTSTAGLTGGITACLRRSAGTAGVVPTNYATTSNNNLYWVNPTAGITNYLTYAEGNTIPAVNAQNTFAQMKAFMVNRDQQSVEQDMSFVSTTGSNATYLTPSGATLAESGGAVIAGFADAVNAYNGLNLRTGYPKPAQTNGGGFSPDLGAYEGDYIYLDLVPPTITYTPITGSCVAGATTLVATIIDNSGVPTSGAGLPVAYFRINAGAYLPAVGTSLGGNQYQFSIGIGSVTGDVITYYVVAQDNAATPNIGALPSAGAAGFTANPPAASTPPTTPNSYANAPTLNGTYTVGVGGQFTTLTQAILNYNAGCVTGPVVFSLIDATYPSETYPIIINQIAATSAINTLTITPSTTAGNVVISGTNTTALIILNGADYVTINGVNGTSTLTISNTSVTPSTNTIAFVNDATFNTITNTIVQGAITGGTGAVIYIAGGNVVGNDNNTISNNTITGVGVNLPLVGFLSIGASPTIDNSNCTVTGNNFANIFSPTTIFSAININSNNNTWTITNNKIYQTAPRTVTTGMTGFGILSSSGNGHNISGNIIGFANATGTGVTTYNSGVGVAFNYRGISTQGTLVGLPSVMIQNNVITNITMTTASTGGMFIGIFGSGPADVNIIGNTIGNTTTTGAIDVTSSASLTGSVIGITIGPTATGINTISNNIIGSIDAKGSTPSFAVSINGISSAIGTNNITNNTIGSTTVTNSINASTASTVGTQTVLGINITSGVTTINNNTIANINQNATTTDAFIRGIYYGGGSGALTINQNTIRNLSGANTNISQAGAAASVQGIHTWAATGLLVDISRNTISALSATNTGTTATIVSGIGINATGVASVTRNQIFGLTNASTGTTLTAPPIVAGFILRSSLDDLTLANNMVSLGNAQTTNTSFVGILNSFTNTTPIKIYHNSVFITGNATAGALPSFGLMRGDFSTTAITTPVDIRNNVFINTRSGGTGAHYAIGNNFGATASATGWGANASNFNVLNVATPANLGHWTTPRTFATWQTNSASETNSVNSSVNFINAANGDLHINTPFPSAVEGTGVDIPSVTVDFDAEIRSANSPVDIGADAGNFFSYPIIVLTPLANNCNVGARTLTVNITDVDGMPTSGAGLPVLYWRINAGAYQAATATFISGSQYQFTLGTGSLVNDVISYYVMAQDNLGNTGSLPSLGASGFTPSPPAVTTPPTTPFAYTNTILLSGNYNVGVSQTYTTLTAAVNAYNTACLGGAVTFSLVDATYPSETYPIVVNNNTQASAVNTLTIKPGTGVTSSISGSNANAILRLNGADFVTIDGSNNNTTTKNLTFENTNTAGAVIWNSSASVTDAATNNTFRNLIVIGNAGTTTLASILIGGSVLGSAANIPNNNISIINNTLSKSQNGVFATGNVITPDQGWVINNNLVGDATIVANQPLRAIAVQNAQGFIINNNQINGISTSSINTSTGILIGAIINGGTVSNNQITNVKNTNTGGYGSNGIFLNSSSTNTNVNIFNNTITDVASYGFASGWANDDNGYGIMVNAGGGYNIYYNSVNMNTNQATAGNSAAINIVSSATALNIRNNIFVNSQTTGTRYAIYTATANTAFTSINYNDYFTAAGGSVGFLTSARATLANWQTATAQDVNSLNQNPIFTTPTNLLPTSCRVDNKGVVIAGITTDIVPLPRSVSTPDMGAYEFTASLVISPATLSNGTLNTAYSQAITQTGLTGTLAWSVSAGALPTGLTLNATSGLLSGTPSVAGTFNFTVQVADGFCTNTRAYTLIIDCLPAASVTFGTAPADGTVGVVYSQTVTQTGLVAPIAWSISNNSLPLGLTLNATTGVISGTPNSAGSYTFTVQAQQSTCTYTQVYTIVIACPVPTFGTAPANGTVGVAYSQIVTQTGLVLPSSWSISAGSLPTGLTLNTTTGEISGTPTVSGSYTFTMQISQLTCVFTQVYTIVIGCPTITISPVTLPSSLVNTAYSQTLSATAVGLTNVYTFALTTGSVPGLSFNAGTATLSGAPTTFGTYPLTFTATDNASGCSTTINYSVVVACATPLFSPATLANATVGTSVNVVVSQTGANPPFTWSLGTGTLPTGVTFDVATATLSGTPTVAGTYTFEINLTVGIGGCTVPQPYTWIVNCPTITFTNTTASAATVGTSYNINAVVTGNTLPITYSVLPALPAGLTLDTSTGAITGTPTTVTASTGYVVTATQTGVCTVTNTYTFAVNCPVITLTPTPAVPATLVAGTAVSYTFATAGNTLAITYSTTGTIPTGMTFDVATGVLSGTPSATGAFTFAVIGTQGSPCSLTNNYTINVNCPVITVTPAVIPTPVPNIPYTQVMSTIGNTSAVVWSQTGTLPMGITFNTATGTFSGTATVLGSFAGTVTATQTNGPCPTTRDYTWNVTCPVVSITTATLPIGFINVPYTITLAQTGYTGTISWSATGLPTGMTMNATTGVISGTVTTFGTNSVTVTLTQGLCSITKVFGLQINSGCPLILLNPATMPAGNVGAAYTATTIVATGGVAPYVFSVSNGTLPVGLSMTPAGVISGTPTTTGTANVNVTATDANGCTGSGLYVMTINAACTAVTITPATLNSGIIGLFYNQTLTSTGGTAPYSYVVTTGTLPTGLTLATNGALTGTVAAPATSTFSVRVTDAIGCTGTISYTLAINPVPTRVIALIMPVIFGPIVDSLRLADVIVGQSGTSTFTIRNNGNSPLTISSIQYPTGFSGAFAGVIPAASSQIVTVTFAPSSVGSFSGTVLVNSDAISGTSTFTISGTGINNVTAIEEFGKPIVTVYPNPSASDFNVRFDNNSKGDYTVKVLDLSGKVVFEDKAEITDSVEEIQLRLGHLANGVYLLHLENKRGKAAVRIVRR